MLPSQYLASLLARVRVQPRDHRPHASVSVLSLPPGTGHHSSPGFIGPCLHLSTWHPSWHGSESSPEFIGPMLPSQLLASLLGQVTTPAQGYRALPSEPRSRVSPGQCTSRSASPEFHRPLVKTDIPYDNEMAKYLGFPRRWPTPEATPGPPLVLGFRYSDNWSSPADSWVPSMYSESLLGRVTTPAQDTSAPGLGTQSPFHFVTKASKGWVPF